MTAPVPDEIFAVVDWIAAHQVQLAVTVGLIDLAAGILALILLHVKVQLDES